MARYRLPCLRLCIERNLATHSRCFRCPPSAWTVAQLDTAIFIPVMCFPQSVGDACAQRARKGWSCHCPGRRCTTCANAARVCARRSLTSLRCLHRLHSDHVRRDAAGFRGGGAEPAAGPPATLLPPRGLRLSASVSTCLQPVCVGDWEVPAGDTPRVAVTGLWPPEFAISRESGRRGGSGAQTSCPWGCWLGVRWQWGCECEFAGCAPPHPASGMCRV